MSKEEEKLLKKRYADEMRKQKEWIQRDIELKEKRKREARKAFPYMSAAGAKSFVDACYSTSSSIGFAIAEIAHRNQDLPIKVPALPKLKSEPIAYRPQIQINIYGKMRRPKVPIESLRERAERLYRTAAQERNV